MLGTFIKTINMRKSIRTAKKTLSGSFRRKKNTNGDDEAVRKDAERIEAAATSTLEEAELFEDAAKDVETKDVSLMESPCDFCAPSSSGETIL